MQRFIIHGVTHKGKRFRPSDWAERLAGVMSQFRPLGYTSSHIAYSPYVVPNTIDGIRCVIVNPRLKELEPRAWQFLIDFASDNELQTSETEFKLS